MNKINRRKFVQNLVLAGGTIVMGVKKAGAAKRKSPSKLHLACNQYPWLVFYQRENRNFNADLDNGLGELASSGMDGYEPLVTNPKEIDRLGPLLTKHGLEIGPREHQS